MIDPTNRVFTNLQTYIDSQSTGYDSIQYTIIESDLPTLFPTVTLSMIGNPGNYDLMNYEGSTEITYEIKVYSNELSKPTNARKLFSFCDDAMRKMGFQRRGDMKPVKLSESVFYLVTRYTRVIGGVEITPFT